MDYDPLQELAMPDLSDALTEEVEDEAVQEVVEADAVGQVAEQTADTFDAGAIGDALQQIYPDLNVEDQELLRFVVSLPQNNRLI